MWCVGSVCFYETFGGFVLFCGESEVFDYDVLASNELMFKGELLVREEIGVRT